MLTVQAWLEFLYTDLIGLVGFRALYRIVARTKRPQSPSGSSSVQVVLDAVRRAGLVYIKPAKCLQRSVIVTRLLRRQGIDADLVIGCQLVAPVKGHAWVEVNGTIVCEYEEGIEHYHIIDRW